MTRIFTFRWTLGCLLTLSALGASALPAGVQPTVLLITDSSLTEAWQPFADFKTRLGHPTAIATLQQIEQDAQGADVPAKLRAYILGAIEQGEVRHIILGGDSAPGGG